MAKPQRAPARSNVVPFRKPAAHPAPYAPFPGPTRQAHNLSEFSSPADLDRVLDVAPYARIIFANEKRLLAYRQNLYKVNVEGRFRYATRREGWSGLIILRLK